MAPPPPPPPSPPPSPPLVICIFRYGTRPPALRTFAGGGSSVRGPDKLTYATVLAAARAAHWVPSPVALHLVYALPHERRGTHCGGYKFRLHDDTDLAAALQLSRTLVVHLHASAAAARLACAASPPQPPRAALHEPRAVPARAEAATGSTATCTASSSSCGSDSCSGPTPAAAPRKMPPPSPPHDIDAGDAYNPLAHAEYASDLYAHLRTEEVRMMPVRPASAHADTAGGGDRRHDHRYRRRVCSYCRRAAADPRAYAALMDWVASAHTHCRLAPDTLYLAAATAARYLHSAALEPAAAAATADAMSAAGMAACGAGVPAELRLVGAAALLLAAKMEEVHAPAVDELCRLGGGGYTRRELLAAEGRVLCALGHRVAVPTAYHFLLRYLKAARADRRMVQLACYAGELSLGDVALLAHAPSAVACACVWVARRNTGRAPWSPTLARQTGRAVQDFEPTLRCVVAALRADASLGANASGSGAIRRKFLSQRYGAVAAMPLNLSLDGVCSARDGSACEGGGGGSDGDGGKPVRLAGGVRTAVMAAAAAAAAWRRSAAADAPCTRAQAPVARPRAMRMAAPPAARAAVAKAPATVQTALKW